MATQSTSTTPHPRAHVLTDVQAASSADMARAALTVAQQRTNAAAVKAEARRQGKPSLSEATVVSYIDWVATQLVADAISGTEANILLRAAELVISKGHAEAQAKPTTTTEPA